MYNQARDESFVKAMAGAVVGGVLFLQIFNSVGGILGALAGATFALVVDRWARTRA